VNGDSTVTYNESEWYFIEFKAINWASKTYDYYVDGELIRQGLEFRDTGISALTRIHLFNFHESLVWWDDISLEHRSDLEISWLSVKPESGSIGSGNNSLVAFHLSTRQMDLGDYRGDVTFSFEDNDTKMIRLPVNLSVIAPEHDLALSVFPFPEEGEAGVPLEMNVTVLNRGTNNETEILLNISINGELVSNMTFSKLNSENSVNPLSSWTPPIAGEYFINISLRHIEGEYLIFNNIFTTNYSAYADPDIAIIPEWMNISIPQGENSSVNVVIENRGLDDLDYYTSLGTSSNALRFDGYNDNVLIEDKNCIDFGNENFSIEFWMKGTGSGNEWIIDKCTPQPRTGYRIFIYQSNLEFEIMYVNAKVEVNVPVGNLRNGDWHHIVAIITVVGSQSYATFIIDGGDPVDGSLRSSKNVSSDAHLTIGGVEANWFKGSIEDVRMFDRVLTHEEALEDFMGQGCYSDRNGTVAWWHFHDGSGDFAYDSSSYNNTGSIHGARWTNGQDVEWENIDWITLSQLNGTLNPLSHGNEPA